MDPVTIATTTVAFLSPYLAEGAKAAAKKAGEALMAALERRFKEKPAAQEALDDVKQNPQNEDFQAALRVQLQKALKANETFQAELAELLEQAQAETPATATQVTVNGSGAAVVGDGAAVAGERGVAVSGDVKGPIVTGDQNRVVQTETYVEKQAE